MARAVKKIEYSDLSIGNTYTSNNYGDVILLEKQGNKVTLEFIDYCEIGIYEVGALLTGSVRPKSLGKESKYSVGTVHKNKKGEEFEVIERNGKNLKVRFFGGDLIKETLASTVKQGTVKNPNSPKRKYIVGNIYANKVFGDPYMIIEVLENPFLKVKFLDEYGYETIAQSTHVIRGDVSNPYTKSLYGIGFHGEYDTGYKNVSLAIKTWNQMMVRGYSEAYLKNQPTYKNVKVCDEWHCFSTFLEWFKENYIEGFHLDKDLLQIGSEYKIYSPNTCLFLDRKMNNFIVIRGNNNKHGVGGISLYSNNFWRAECTEFNTGVKLPLGIFKTKEEARKSYIDFKIEQIECAKIYMKNQGHYSDEIISNLDKLKELI